MFFIKVIRWGIEYYICENKGEGRNASPPRSEVRLEYPRQHLGVALRNADRILLIQKVCIMNIIKCIIKFIVWEIVVITLICTYFYNVGLGFVYSIVIGIYLLSTIDDEEDR